MSNLILLLSFDRGYLSKTTDSLGNLVDEISYQTVKCHLWFDGNEDLQKFLKKHRTVDVPTVIKKRTKKVKWVNFMTITKEDLGIK